METTKLSVRGQIAIPKKIREELNFNEGDLLEVLTKGDLIHIKKNNSVHPCPSSPHTAFCRGPTLVEFRSAEATHVFTNRSTVRVLVRFVLDRIRLLCTMD